MTDTSVDAGRHRPAVRPIQAAHGGGPSRWPVSTPLDTAMPWQLSWRYWSRKLRIAATDASTGCPGSATAVGQVVRPSSTTESPWRCGSNWTSWPRAGLWSAACRPAGLRTARHRQDPRAPWATDWWKLATPSFAPACRLVQELLAAKRDLDLPRQLRNRDNFDFLLTRRPGLPAPGRRGIGGPLHPHRRTLRCAGRWASRQTWSSRSGSASLPTPWPPPRRLTGSCTTPSCAGV